MLDSSSSPPHHAEKVAAEVGDDSSVESSSERFTGSAAATTTFKKILDTLDSDNDSSSSISSSGSRNNNNNNNNSNVDGSFLSKFLSAGNTAAVQSIAPMCIPVQGSANSTSLRKEPKASHRTIRYFDEADASITLVSHALALLRRVQLLSVCPRAEQLI